MTAASAKNAKNPQKKKSVRFSIQGTLHLSNGGFGFAVRLRKLISVFQSHA